MRLGLLLDQSRGVRFYGDAEVDIRALSCDSRTAGPGCLFFALAKDPRQRELHVQQALSRGARAVVVNGGWEAYARPAATIVVCEQPRLAMACAASRFYNAPSKRLDLVGITGTSGKTTTACLAGAVFEAESGKAGLIGTLGAFVAGRKLYSGLTTPEALDLEALLDAAERAGVRRVALEVSSIGIAEGRVEALHFKAAVFTGLGRDHLDYHVTTADYFQAKLRLFTEILPRSQRPEIAVIARGDDPYGRRVLEAAKLRKLSFGFSEDCDVRPLAFETTLDGIKADISVCGQKLRLSSPLIGKLNLLNILATAAICAALEISAEALAEGLQRCSRAPGRAELIPNPGGAAVLVDYAHKPDALEMILSSVRAVADGRLVCVFGCGGDRDAGKRPLMGEVAGRLADLTIVTSDNPRSEDPLRIIEQIESGLASLNVRKLTPAQVFGGEYRGYVVEPDRRKAIELALRVAAAGDIVIIAGKGHETYQQIGDKKFDFDDRQVAREVLSEVRRAQCA
jgi:UDP-N-acetylmuramoyl-L-alanyl-D-glutamate--2,6-diaminopimelate ligase